MLRRLVPVIFLVFFNLLSATSSQSCIRNEFLAVIEELEHHNHPVVSTTLNQSSSIGCAEIEELNNTIQQGLQEIRGELQGIQSIKKELHGIQENINNNLKGVQ